MRDTLRAPSVTSGIPLSFRGEPIMAMKKNERFRCVNPKCCCEIEVVRDSLDAASVRNPRLCVRSRYGEDVLSEFRPLFRAAKQIIRVPL